MKRGWQVAVNMNTLYKLLCVPATDPPYSPLPFGALHDEHRSAHRGAVSARRYFERYRCKSVSTFDFADSARTTHRGAEEGPMPPLVTIWGQQCAACVPSMRLQRTSVVPASPALTKYHVPSSAHCLPRRAQCPVSEDSIPYQHRDASHASGLIGWDRKF